MSKEQPYHFEQSHSRASIRGNLHSYAKLARSFKELRPIFEDHGFHVFNCNPTSVLKTFDYISYEDAIKIALDEFDNVDVANERTAGLYDLPKPPFDPAIDTKPPAPPIKGTPYPIKLPGPDAVPTPAARITP